VPPSTIRAAARPSAPRRLLGGQFGPAPRTSAVASSVLRRVAILIYDGVTLLDVAGPAEVFMEANRFGADYRVVTVDGAVSAVPVPGRTEALSKTLSSSWATAPTASPSAHSMRDVMLSSNEKYHRPIIFRRHAQAMLGPATTPARTTSFAAR
jgi:hypothetical protein